LKKCVPTRRSIASIWLAVAIIASAGITMNAVTTIVHTKIGIRASVIPGARHLSAVTMISTALMSPEISVNVII
jgi:hypothetical protein